MDKIQLKILGISSGNVASSYTLIMEELGGERKLPIVIGVLEAQAIAIKLENIKPIRPMTHDLFKTFAKSFKVRIKEVFIYKLYEGIFYSYIIASDGNEILKIDSRTSDAIALAIRFNCPIYTNEEILSEAGIALKSFQMKNIEHPKEEAVEDEKSPEGGGNEDVAIEDLSAYSIKELTDMLDKAIAEEDYIFAAKIRDAIKIKENK